MADESTPRRDGAWAGGLIGLLVALGAAGVLAADHLQLLGEHLPGCGPDSGCAQLTRGPWGRLPGLEWPTAYAGLALFAGLTVAWIALRGRSRAALRPVALVGALASIGLIAVMLSAQAFCPWCLTVHGGNLLFVVCLLAGKATAGQASAGRGALLAGGAVAALGTLALVLVDGARQQTLAAERDARLAASTAAVLDGAHRDGENADGRTFSGRWVRGPADAPIRVVMFADYQCAGCNAVEREAESLLATRGDLSLSVKQFPMGSDCNDGLEQDIHPNACEAARAAEAAGELGGNDGYWRMHDWLLERVGEFTRDELLAALPALGFDAEVFPLVMAGRDVAGRIHGDIAEGKTLGLHFVPMVFVNGVELKEVETAGALTGVVEALAVQLASGAEPTFTAPATAAQKAVDDWRAQPSVSMPPDASRWPRGPAGAPVDVVVFGDFGQEYSRDLAAELERILATASDVRYTFRHFPMDPSCNALPALRRRAPGSRRLAALAEAAGRLAGRDAFWRVHRWLYEQQGPVGDADLAQAAPALGLDAGAWLDESRSPAVQDAIADDVRAWGQLSLKGVPIVFVNGRQAPRWRLLEEPAAKVLEDILQAARGDVR